MDAEGSHDSITCGTHGTDRSDRVVVSKVPESDFAISGSGDEFSIAAALHVDVGDPLGVVAPEFDHGKGWLKTLIKYSNTAVTESSDEDVPGNLIRG